MKQRKVCVYRFALLIVRMMSTFNSQTHFFYEIMTKKQINENFVRQAKKESAGTLNYNLYSQTVTADRSNWYCTVFSFIFIVPAASYHIIFLYRGWQPACLPAVIVCHGERQTSRCATSQPLHPSSASTAFGLAIWRQHWIWRGKMLAQCCVTFNPYHICGLDFQNSLSNCFFTIWESRLFMW